jgi:DNA repair and recombination protein RAD54B
METKDTIWCFGEQQKCRNRLVSNFKPNRRKFTTKKHKTWEDEGVLALSGGYASLQDMSGRSMGRTAFNKPLLVGSTLSLGGKELEIDSIIKKEDFLAGRPFLNAGKLSGSKTDDKNLPQVRAVKPVMSIQAQMKAQMVKEKEDAKKTLNVSAPKSKATKTAFKNPVIESTVVTQVAGPKPVPRHDPNATNALVMKRPTRVPKGKQIVDVVLDPILGKHLRNHQREGVKFLYECVMGLREFEGEGCILADEMGLGKTLQTIALLWTLLKQNPICGEPPVVKKALIVCPVTLINNWQKEFRKWLGNERIGVFVADGKKTRLTDFTMGKSYNVMIIGYERLRTVAEDLTKGPGIDIVIADEGHRLKTVQNKSAQAIQSLNTAKRVILSGTPIQNDLSEFYCMVNFVNDGLLGTYKAFMKNFETPIVRSRQPNAITKDIELGEARSAELAETTSPFILRRTADILSNYLPPKSEYVLFCNPTPVQANIYRHVVASPMFQCALGNSESALQLITILKKLCNSPSLLNAKAMSADQPSNSTSVTNLLATLPPDLLKVFGNAASTKIRILDKLLHRIRHETDEKVVLVSNYTSTLDLLQTLLTSTGLPYLRLDGSTPAKQRQGLVDEFNRATTRSHFAFLLSAKAGGMGINLIGASRLILFDVDWNPATDDQAMARIHREGQRRHCKIYRFLVKGGLEERIWQRQVVKRGLADSILEGGGSGGGGNGGGKHGVAQFSREELRDLFRLDENEGLRTHELIGCLCGGAGNFADSTAIEEEKEEQPYFIDDSVASDNEGEDELPDMPTLIKASRLSNAAMQEQELKISSGTHHLQANAKNKQGQDMQSLMLYSHVNTSQFSQLQEESEELEQMEEIIDDDCLMGVLRGELGEAVVGGVAYVFKKTSKSKAEQARDEGRTKIEDEGFKSSFFQLITQA